MYCHGNCIKVKTFNNSLKYFFCKYNYYLAHLLFFVVKTSGQVSYFYRALVFCLCSRYLQRGFSFAFHHAQPDVIVFLGDLIDEGSRADNKQYDIYFHRFQKIFRASKATQVK